ncbi:hypothetical protein Hanom_Chr13g01200651 [Helianthus anomalus]
MPYNIKEIFRQVKIEERRKEAKRAREEIVVSDSDLEILGDEDEDENNDDDKSNKKDDKDDKDDKGNDDDDKGASWILVENPNVQERIEEFLNDEIHEQEDDSQHEASTSGKKHAD